MVLNQTIHWHYFLLLLSFEPQKGKKKTTRVESPLVPLKMSVVKLQKLSTKLFEVVIIRGLLKLQSTLKCEQCSNNNKNGRASKYVLHGGG